MWHVYHYIWLEEGLIYLPTVPPSGYLVIHQYRSDGQGAGFGVVFRNFAYLAWYPILQNTSSFEAVFLMLALRDRTGFLLGVLPTLMPNSPPA